MMYILFIILNYLIIFNLKEKKEDEQDIIEKEYQNFCKTYFTDKEGSKDDKNDPK